jgi:hypothetical protein
MDIPMPLWFQQCLNHGLGNVRAARASIRQNTTAMSAYSQLENPGFVIKLDGSY